MSLENHLQPCVLEHPLSLCKKRFGNKLYYITGMTLEGNVVVLSTVFEF